MFIKCLLQKKGLVVPNPGSTDGSYIIAGSTNNVYTVIPEKGNSLKCDRACINVQIFKMVHFIKICSIVF